MQLANNIQSTRTTAAATGELSLGEIAAHNEMMESNSEYRELVADSLQWASDLESDIRPEWDTEPARLALQLQFLKERSAAVDAAFQAEMDALGIKL